MAAAPFSNAPLPVIVILTDNKSHRSTGKLPVANAQQLGEVLVFGPVTVAIIPVFMK
ncbi:MULTISPECIES: hypothetical protein [Bacillus]|uniref:hypothetical protein n=1 Tax=Bacillus TaxID=1386 RepID=UPI0016785B2D|nr:MULTISPECIES: hypothetical protein [Bacillus]